MATVKFGTALGSFGQPQYFFSGDLDPDGIIVDKKTHETVGVRYRDSSTGSEIVIHGEGLQVRNHVPTKGTVTEVDFYNTNGKLLMSVDVSHDSLTYGAHDLYEKAVNHQLGDILAALLSENNTITGSKNADYIVSGNGNDVIHGGGGGDWITGMGGTDKLYGGTDNGTDVFWFGKGQGHDTVYDYQAGIDQIALLTTDHLYHYDVGEDVVLQFVKAKDPNNPLNTHAADTMVIKHANFSDLDFYHM